MKTCCVTFATALLLAATPMVVLAQATAPTPPGAASATPAPLPGPRLLTPEQKRDNADITAAFGAGTRLAHFKRVLPKSSNSSLFIGIVVRETTHQNANASRSCHRARLT